MKTAILLGLRLSVDKGGQRARTLFTAMASGVGVAVVLVVWGIAVSALGTTDQFRFNPGAGVLLMAGAVGMVALPVAVLVATMARLSAGVRDRRLANLRLLGLTAGQTRLVAGAEVGFAACVGAVLGVVMAATVAAVGSGLLRSRGDSAEVSLWAPGLAWVVVPVMIPLVALVTAVLPQHLGSERALSHARQRAGGPVRLLRVAPLVVGFILCWLTTAQWFDGDSRTLGDGEIAATVTGIALLGVGMLLVVPVFMRLIAVALLRVGDGPVTTLVARRLQAQPAGATRVIAALMMGLFIVVGARGVMVVFLATPQYVAAADFVEREQTAEVTAAVGAVDRTVADLGGIDGVKSVVAFPVLYGDPAGGRPDGSNTVIVVVATCEELADGGPTIPGCSDNVPSVVGHPWFGIPDPDTLHVRSYSNNEPRGPGVDIDLQGASVIRPAAFERAVGALSGTPAIIMPPDVAGITAIVAGTDRLVTAKAGAGRYLYDRVTEAGYRYNSEVDLQNYDFVQGMLTVVWTLAAVVIAIGLGTFTVAGIDRAINRRRELTALRLIGTPATVLRRAQWLEAALPTVLGSGLAIVAGAYAGATYLQRGDSLRVPLGSTVALALLAIGTSLLLASVTTIGTDARVTPDHIRAE